MSPLTKLFFYVSVTIPYSKLFHISTKSAKKQVASVDSLYLSQLAFEC